MDRTLSRRWFLLGAASALFVCGVARADEVPRPDFISDDETRPRILVVAVRPSPPGPIEIPGPIIDVKPVGDISGYFGGGSGRSGVSAMPLGGGASAGTTANQRIEASLKKAAAQLR